MSTQANVDLIETLQKHIDTLPQGDNSSSTMNLSTLEDDEFREVTIKFVSVSYFI
jgi:hypothetical protein